MKDLELELPGYYLSFLPTLFLSYFLFIICLFLLPFSSFSVWGGTLEPGVDSVLRRKLPVMTQRELSLMYVVLG
jgi:hypothetical protein